MLRRGLDRGEGGLQRRAPVLEGTADRGVVRDRVDEVAPLLPVGDLEVAPGAEIGEAPREGREHVREATEPGPRAGRIGTARVKREPFGPGAAHAEAPGEA